MKSWQEYIDLLKPAGELFDLVSAPQTEQLRGEVYRQLAMNLSQGYFLHFQATPMHPEFSPFENSVFLAQPNPDAVYYFTPVEGNGIYRIVGERGTAPVAGFATGKNMIGMADPPGPGYDNYDLDRLTLQPDGSFEVVFSQVRPEGYAGDWRCLNADAKFIMLRQFSYDWGKERDVRVAIERLNAPVLKPAMSAAEIDRNLTALFGGYAARLTRLCLNMIKRTVDRDLVNKVALTNFEDIGNGADWPQAYWECVFDIAEDEALIIETPLPEQHHYWNVQVIDALWSQVELVYRQTSLNGLQARPDSDGYFRAVLCRQDPGVHNWLDTGGHLFGMLIGRWYKCSTHPVPTLKKIKSSDIRAYLPQDTPEISATEREEALRNRCIGAQLRRRW